jgi:hypothetical protein
MDVSSAVERFSEQLTEPYSAASELFPTFGDSSATAGASNLG